MCVYIYIERERQRQREIETERERQRERQRQTYRQTDRKRKSERERGWGQRETKTERQTETETKRERDIPFVSLGDTGVSFEANYRKAPSPLPSPLSNPPPPGMSLTVSNTTRTPLIITFNNRFYMLMITIITTGNFWSDFTDSKPITTDFKKNIQRLNTHSYIQINNI